MKPKNVAVIGAGPAGMTAAYELSKADHRVTVFEAAPAVGGMSRTIELWGQKVDIGPHRFFSTDTRVNKLWLEVVGKDYAMVDRLTRIFYRNRYFHYPLQPVDALMNLGPIQAAFCMLSYLKEKLNPTTQDGSFESWVTSRFGSRLFETFFKHYSEKLWGISCRDLDADFAAQRIKKLSLWEAVKNALGGAKGKHKTLVDQFAYPLQGTGMVYERMAERVRTRGNTILLNTPVKRLLVSNTNVDGVELRDGTAISFDEVISTMPLTLLVKALQDVPQETLAAAAKLTFRNTIIVYLKVEGENIFPDNWLYVHSPELKTGRITNFRNWIPELYGDQKSTIVALEYWCYEDETWQTGDSDLIAKGKEELRRTRLIGNTPISEGFVYRIPRCYPVYRRGYRECVATVTKYIRSLNHLQVIGRYGSFKYNNQDHSILMGMLAAENIAKGSTHDLWEINTDYDSYQEHSIISRTGLVKQD